MDNRNVQEQSDCCEKSYPLRSIRIEVFLRIFNVLAVATSGLFRISFATDFRSGGEKPTAGILAASAVIIPWRSILFKWNMTL